MPVFLAGYISSNGTIKYGGGFTVTRKLPGAYVITIVSSKIFVPVATSVAMRLIPRVASSQADGAGNFVIQIELRDSSTSMIDGDFTFIAVEKSGP